MGKGGRWEYPFSDNMEGSMPPDKDFIDLPKESGDVKVSRHGE
jgi:hypothetical protein